MSNRYVVKFLSVAMLVSLVGCAGAQPMPPSGKYDLEFTAQSTYPIKRVEWIVVDDIDAACRGMSLYWAQYHSKCVGARNAPLL